MIKVNGHGAAERKSFLLPFPGLKRQGQLMAKHIADIGIEANSPIILPKKEKSHRLAKLFPASPRYLAASPADVFRKTLHQGKSPPVVVNDKRTGSVTDFRPHQPDITADLQSGKLSLPLGLANVNALKGAVPTPMANKINPYTNGVAASFPPGIDPYEGFIRYAAENLESPLNNVVDYHSLEQYYGSQHPLSLHNSLNKDHAFGQHLYADSFGHNNEAEVGNSPPGLPPPHGEQVSAERFHERNNAPGSPYEQGVDEFHAPSPGMSASPPRPIRPQAQSSPESSFYGEDGPGRGSPPGYEPPPPGFGPPYSQNPHPHQHHQPFHQHGSPGEPHHHGSPGEPHHHVNPGEPHHHGNPGELHHHESNGPSPEDLKIYEEGPPPAGSHPPLPPPPGGPPQGPGGPGSPGQPEFQESNISDGGDDAIWSILDLADMLEKGQFPGQGGSAADGKPQQESNSPQPSSGGGNKTPAAPPSSDRVVVPIYTRAPPPRANSAESSAGIPYNSYGEESAPPSLPPGVRNAHLQHDDDAGPRPGLGPHAQNPSYPYSSSDGGFDYNEQGGGHGHFAANTGAGAGAPHPSPYGSPDNSQEGSTDYAEYK